MSDVYLFIVIDYTIENQNRKERIDNLFHIFWKEGIKMLTLIFIICMVSVFGKLGWLALRGTWGLTKMFFTLLFLPLILIGLFVKGLLIIAFPILIIGGLVYLLREV